MGVRRTADLEMRRIPRVAILLCALVTTAFALKNDLQAALESITAREIRAHLSFLAHDLLEGRGPGTRGDRLAAHYIATQFARLRLEPVRGSYFQPVPVVGVTVDPERVELVFKRDGVPLAARFGMDAVIWPGVPDTAVSVSGDVVFVGYGVTAPEYDWDDFKDVDVAGKVLLVLVGEPPAPPGEPDLFDGRALTYYGRWTYKFEEAQRRGASGVLLIHSPDAAGYGWSVVLTSWMGEQLSLPREAGSPPPLAVEGWVSRDLARRLLRLAGHDLNSLTARAARRDFRPVEVGLGVRASMPARVRHFETANVVGLVPGHSPSHKHEVVIYTAHYDHLGIGPAVNGDSIYNGAYDNASGVAAMLEIAEAFTRLDPGPDRSVLFIATTAEESGLLGSTHYTRYPLFPLDRTVAVINIDGANLWGETSDVTALGAEKSGLGRILEARAREMGMRLVPDRAPEHGFDFRLDHYPFAAAGVPAITLEHGIEFRGRTPDWGYRVLRRYEIDHYHRPSDHYDPAFNLAGAVQQARLAFLVGYDAAMAATWPDTSTATPQATQRPDSIRADRR